MKKLVCFCFFMVFSVNIFAEELIELDTRNGVTQKFELIEAKNPVASLILFAGGKGALDLSSSFGSVNYGWGKLNFLVRVKDDFVKNGFNVAVVDAPSDMQGKKGMLGGFRDSISHQEDIDKVITYLKEKYSLPIWLIGTSRGTESAASIAINTKVGIDGLILSSSISEENSKGVAVTQMDLDEIKVPVLITAHKDDGCKHTPASGAKKIKELLTNTKKVQVMIFEGGNEVQGPCRGKSHHGYLGIEEKVVESMSKYIKENI